MTTLAFTIERNRFQSAHFRKYINELRTNIPLLIGGKVVMIFFCVVLALNLILKNHAFGVFTAIVSVFFFAFLLLVLYGIFRTWKEGEEDYVKLFKEGEILYFHYDNSVFAYSNKPEFKKEDITFWSEIKCIYLLQNIKILIIEKINFNKLYLYYGEYDVEQILEISNKNGVVHYKI